MTLTGTLSAQTQTKRPSWSQGLPERQASQQPGKPGFDPELEKVNNKQTPTMQSERPTTPTLNIDIATQPDLNFDIKPDRNPIPESKPIRRAGQRSIQYRQQNTPDINPLHHKYKWNVVKTTPIDIPDRYATQSTLKVRIYINPQGEVIKVAAAAPDVPAMMLKEAQKSIENWRFEAPKDIGISDNLAKTFTIEIKTG